MTTETDGAVTPATLREREEVLDAWDRDHADLVAAIAVAESERDAERKRADANGEKYAGCVRDLTEAVGDLVTVRNERDQLLAAVAALRETGRRLTGNGREVYIGHRHMQFLTNVEWKDGEAIRALFWEQPHPGGQSESRGSDSEGKVLVDAARLEALGVVRDWLERARADESQSIKRGQIAKCLDALDALEGPP